MALYEIEKNSSGVPTGNYKHVAGRGRAEYGASTVRSGEFTIPAKEAGSASWVQITFAEPMPDTNYEVEFTLSHYWDACSLIPFDKETTGFKAQVGYIQAGAGLSNRTVTYTAYRLYTDTEYNNILGAMPSDASASNKLMTASGVAGLINTESMSPIAASDVDDFYSKFASAIIAKYPVGSSFFVYVDWAGTNTYLHIGMVVNSTSVMFISTTYSRADNNYIVLVASGTVYKQTL